MQNTEKGEQLKTRQQEKAYHELFRQIANHCMNHGITMKMVLDHLETYRPDVDDKFVKSTWRVILETKTGKKSTREQTKDDIKVVQEEFHRLWAEITGVSFDFPSQDSLAMQHLINSQV